MIWLYNGKNVESIEELGDDVCKSFVYCITNLVSSKRYFGKKRLHFSRKKKIKGRVNRKIVVKESDWKTYWGSSEELLSEIERLGSSNFRREILRCCKSLSEASYYELKYQMEHDVLLYPDKFYNAYVGCRISRRQLGVK